METGRNVAEFLSQLTGRDYVSLYDQSVKEEQMQTENAKKAFNSLVNKINECDKKRLQDVID
jgi:hypothetical protein